jgi:hypothetical protein
MALFAFALRNFQALILLRFREVPIESDNLHPAGSEHGVIGDAGQVIGVDEGLVNPR